MNEIDTTNLTKRDLYDFITSKINSLNYDLTDIENYSINSKRIAFLVCKDLEIKNIDFEGTKLCGILYKGKNKTTIALNSRRSHRGQNFDCAHEVVHYWLHDNNIFYCKDKATDYFEWQANEGAAQLLMPYQVFIPRYCDTLKTCTELFSLCNDFALKMAIKKLSEQFSVGEIAIRNRIKSLQYEIIQYNNTQSIELIDIVSLNKQNTIQVLL